MTGVGRPRAGRDTLRAAIPLIVIVGVALAARLALVAISPREIGAPDGLEYLAVARNLLEHGSYGLQTLRPPGYPTLVAGVFALFGPDLLALRIVEAILGAVAVGLLGAFGMRYLGRPAGLTSAAVASLHPILAYLPVTQYTENTLLLFLVLAFGTAAGAAARVPAWRWGVSGALFGLAALIRPNALFLLPGLFVGLVLAHRHLRVRGLIPIVVLGLCFVATVTPWIVRNHLVHGRWFFIATGGGRQFWMANNPNASPSPVTRQEPDSAMYEELWRLPDEVAQEKLYYRRGAAFVRENPMRATQLYALRLRNLFALHPTTKTQSPLAPWKDWVQAAVSSIILLGAALALRRIRCTPLLWPMLGAIASFTLLSTAFLTVARYRIAIEPCLLWMAGFGWTAMMADRAQSKKR